MRDLADRRASLSPRELEVLSWSARGDYASECANRLGISQQTVKNELSQVYRKLKVRGLVEAMAVMGWVYVPLRHD